MSITYGNQAQGQHLQINVLHFDTIDCSLLLKLYIKNRIVLTRNNIIIMPYNEFWKLFHISLLLQFVGGKTDISLNLVAVPQVAIQFLKHKTSINIKRTYIHLVFTYVEHLFAIEAEVLCPGHRLVLGSLVVFRSLLFLLKF